VIPNRIIHGQAHKPAKQEIVIQLLHQQAFAADGVWIMIFIAGVMRIGEDKRILDFCGLAATMTGKIQVANFIQAFICKHSTAFFIIKD